MDDYPITLEALLHLADGSAIVPVHDWHMRHAVEDHELWSSAPNYHCTKSSSGPADVQCEL
eukprot:3491453-Prymnesium_polylepis.1